MTPSPNGLAHASSASTVTKACQEFVDVGVTPKPDIVLKVIVASVQLHLFAAVAFLFAYQTFEYCGGGFICIIDLTKLDSVIPQLLFSLGCLILRFCSSVVFCCCCTSLVWACFLLCRVQILQYRIEILNKN